jgi:hypothetical protein
MDRCIHYDGFMQRSQDAALVEQRKEMNARHAKLAKAMSGKVAARIATLQPEDLSPGELGRWMQVISMVERLALGEGPGNAAVDVDVNVQVDARQQDITLDAAHIGEVMDRLAALGVVPQPIASTVIDVGDSEVVTPEGGTSSTE